MILTDIDGVKFMIDKDMIDEVNDRKSHREIVTKMKDHLLVREDVGYIMWLAMEERNAGPRKR